MSYDSGNPRSMAMLTNVRVFKKVRVYVLWVYGCFQFWCMEVLNIGVWMFTDVQVLGLWCMGVLCWDVLMYVRCMDVLCWDVLMYVRCLEVLGRYWCWRLCNLLRNGHLLLHFVPLQYSTLYHKLFLIWAQK